MNFDEYQSAAEVTSNFATQQNEERLVCGLLALGGEVGEVQNYVKKGIWHGHGVDPAVVKEELGDIMWYIAEVASCLSFKLSDVADFNIEKLRQRYPDGFSEEASKNRKR